MTLRATPAGVQGSHRVRNQASNWRKQLELWSGSWEDGGLRMAWRKIKLKELLHSNTEWLFTICSEIPMADGYKPGCINGRAWIYEYKPAPVGDDRVYGIFASSGDFLVWTLFLQLSGWSLSLVKERRELILSDVLMHVWTTILAYINHSSILLKEARRPSDIFGVLHLALGKSGKNNKVLLKSSSSYPANRRTKQPLPICFPPGTKPLKRPSG
jgi:hypothetical protein